MITLGVKDMEKAIRFYENGLGLSRMSFEGGTAFFMLNGSWLSLYPWNELAEDAAVSQDGTGFRGITLAHVVSSKEEVRNILDQAVRSGGKLIKRHRTCFGEATPDISLILMGICGRWLGIPISGPGLKTMMKHNHSIVSTRLITNDVTYR